MKPGTRVTSHQFTMGDWEADETAEIEFRTAYLWIVPAKVEGSWTLREQGGSNAQYAVNLSQKYQKISGDVSVGGKKQPLVGATLRGEEISFVFNDEKGVTRKLTGTVRGNELSGVLKGGAAEAKVTGSRK
jgi:hypothetical protein